MTESRATKKTVLPVMLASVLMAFGAFGAGLTGMGPAGWDLAASASARPVEIQAHRGGPNVEGAGVYPENSMSAFRHSLAQGWVIEFDLMRSSDGVPVVMHDDRLDRTTDCDGKVSALTWAEISGCELDTIGINDATEELPANDPRREAIPQLAEVLALLEQAGGRANIEVKYPDVGFASAVYGQIAGSGVPPRNVIIQNFAKPSLVPVPELLPGAGSSLLVLNGSDYYFAQAKSVKANWISPSWQDMTEMPRDEYVTAAHARGLKVVPWTVDDETSLLAVGEAGADAVISNDPTLAQRLIGPVARPGTRLGWQLAGARKVRRGKLVTLRVRVNNSGKTASGRVRLRTTLKGRARIVGGKKRVIGSVPAGGSRTVRFKVRVRPKARAGSRVRLAIRAVSLRESDRLAPAKRTRAIRVTR